MNTTNNSSLLNFSLIKGIFNATITDYKEFPVLLDSDRGGCTDHVIRDAFILLDLHLDSGETIQTRLYSKRIPYFIRSLNAQFDNAYFSLRELLEYARTHEFMISIDEDPRYGQQVEYNASKINNTYANNI